MRRAQAALAPLLLAPARRAAAAEYSVTLRDEARGRDVTAVGCAPDAGDSSVLYVFGHGFDCAGADYLWLCGTPGVAVASVVSPGSPYMPDMPNLALDQDFLGAALTQQSAQNKSSPVYGRLSGKVIIGGHSMGGGTAVDAADPANMPGSVVDGLAVLAPGGVRGSPNVTAPALIVVGAEDCGPNEANKTQVPLYGRLQSTEKALVVLAGADHCGWTTATTGVCGKTVGHDCPTLTRDQQHVVGRKIIAAFAAVVAGGGWAAFEEILSDGETEGSWSYVSHLTPPGKAVGSECPCPGIP